MKKSKTREVLIERGAELVLAKGFNNTGIQEILAAAGVPKGSFYFHFKSKEAFGLALVDHYLARYRVDAERCLRKEHAVPLERLRRFFRVRGEARKNAACLRGCPIGNISQEMSGQSEAFRLKLNHAFSEIKAPVARCLREAQQRGDIDARWDANALADFVINAWQGTLIEVKIKQSTEPLESFERMVFDFLQPALAHRPPDTRHPGRGYDS